ncbi:MAG: hypothetical protein ACYSR7_04270 [Planctomycetota bacterium]|jgi:hypothetical protein
MVVKNKRPKDDVVKFVIKEVIRNRKVRTQTELARLSSDMLKQGSRESRITGRRARALALQMPDVKVSVETKHGSVPSACPCCSTKCSYIGSDNRWIPRRYEFDISE